MPLKNIATRKTRTPRKPKATRTPHARPAPPKLELPADPSLGLDLALGPGETAFDHLSAYRTLVILRGLPGSGCDDIVRGLLAQAQYAGREVDISVATVYEAFRVSPDDAETPEYKFDADKIQPALADVHSSFCAAARDSMAHDGILDPADELYVAEPATNVRIFVMHWINAEPHEFRPLTQVAALCGWDVSVFFVPVSDIRDIEICRRRTQHLVAYPTGYLEQKALALLSTDAGAQADYRRILEERAGPPPAADSGPTSD